MYPQWLEKWWVERALRELNAPDLAAASARLESEIQRLSDLFTTERETRFGDYGRDEGLLLAYGLFFFPQTFVRSSFPVREAIEPRGWRPPGDGRAIRLLDLGSGLGGATLGTAHALAGAFPGLSVEALAVDQSTASLATLRELAKMQPDGGGQLTLETARGDLRTWFAKENQGRRWDWIVASFSVGEAFFGQPTEAIDPWLHAALGHLTDNGLLLILEPALRETAERLEAARDRLARMPGRHIWAPCLHHGPCPLLAEGSHWCHEVRRQVPPESLAWLNRHLHRNIHDVKFSFLLVGNHAPKRPWESGDPAQTARLVTPLRIRKGRFFWGGCAADGLRHDYELQKRDVGQGAAGVLAETARGDIVESGPGRWVGRPPVFRLGGNPPPRNHSRPTARVEPVATDHEQVVPKRTDFS